MRHKAVHDKADDQGDRTVENILGERFAARDEVQIHADCVQTRDNGQAGDHVGDRVIAVLFAMHHGVQNKADDSDNQKNVLRQQYDGLVLYEQPEHTEERQA